MQQSQLLLFVFLGAVAVGTLIGGPIGDRIGRKAVIWGSILGVLPFTLVLPHVNLVWTAVLSVIIGVVMASAFSAILVYAQSRARPGGPGFGHVLRLRVRHRGHRRGDARRAGRSERLDFVFQVCAFLPLIGLLTVFLPAERDLVRR